MAPKRFDEMNREHQNERAKENNDGVDDLVLLGILSPT
jgi:hypothetical protein